MTIIERLKALAELLETDDPTGIASDRLESAMMDYEGQDRLISETLALMDSWGDPLADMGLLDD